MQQSIFSEYEFYLLVLFSLILPFGIYYYLMKKRAISRKTILLLANVLILIAGVDVLLLKEIKVLADRSISSWDNILFVSELSIALYLLPALFAGIGINMISHVLIQHLTEAEKRFDKDSRKNESK